MKIIVVIIIEKISLLVYETTAVTLDLRPVEVFEFLMG